MKSPSHTDVSGSKPTSSPDQRLASRPAMVTRLHGILELMDAALAVACSADEAEARVLDPWRELGRDVLQQWAGEVHTRAQHQMPRVQPGAIDEAKKLLIWQTT